MRELAKQRPSPARLRSSPGLLPRSQHFVSAFAPYWLSHFGDVLVIAARVLPEKPRNASRFAWHR
jgi:hypothetical protein